jgi:aspartate 1-decarboxylase
MSDALRIDEGLLALTDIIPGEQVCVWNASNGHRLETYALPAPKDSGQIVINGAAARHFHEGDKIIIAPFLLTDEPVQPKMIAVDSSNKFSCWLAAISHNFG